MLVMLCLLAIASASFSRAEDVLVNDGWKFRPDPNSMGVTKHWMQAGFDDATWETLTAGHSWSDQGHFNYDGVSWYRKRITIAPRFRGKFIVFQAVNDSCIVYFDGKQVATQAPSSDPSFRSAFVNTPPFRVRLPNAESVAIAIRVTGTDWHRIYSPGPGLSGDVTLSDSVLLSGSGYWLAPDKFVSREEWLTALRQERVERRQQLQHSGRLYEGPYAWNSHNFIQGFIFTYDTRFYDYKQNRYRRYGQRSEPFHFCGHGFRQGNESIRSERYVRQCLAMDRK